MTLFAMSSAGDGETFTLAVLKLSDGDVEVDEEDVVADDVEVDEEDGEELDLDFLTLGWFLLRRFTVITAKTTL